MSHTVKISTQFKKWDTLVKTFNQLGWTMKENCKAKTYPSDPARNTIYKHVAVNPEAHGYDVGINISESGEIELFWDPFGGSIERSLGRQMATLKKDYVINIAKEEFEDVQVLEMLADGSIIIEADDGL